MKGVSTLSIAGLTDRQTTMTPLHKRACRVDVAVCFMQVCVLHICFDHQHNANRCIISHRTLSNTNTRRAIARIIYTQNSSTRCTNRNEWTNGVFHFISFCCCPAAAAEPVRQRSRCCCICCCRTVDHDRPTTELLVHSRDARACVAFYRRACVRRITCYTVVTLRCFLLLLWRACYLCLFHTQQKHISTTTRQSNRDGHQT